MFFLKSERFRIKQMQIYSIEIKSDHYMGENTATVMTRAV